MEKQLELPSEFQLRLKDLTFRPQHLDGQACMYSIYCFEPASEERIYDTSCWWIMGLCHKLSNGMAKIAMT
jgi:hypothetical protein